MRSNLARERTFRPNEQDVGWQRPSRPTLVQVHPSGRSGIRVVHVTTSLTVGGAQTALCKLIEKSARNGGDIVHSVVSLMSGGALRSRLLDAGVEVDELGLARGSIPVGRTLQLAGAVARHRPDVIHGWMYHGIMAATVAHCWQRRSSSLVWGIRHSPASSKDEKWTTLGLIRIEGHLSWLPHAIVYCSQAAARRHEDLGYRPEKSLFIPNGFDIENFRPRAGAKARLAAELGLDPATPLVGIVGRFHPDKDFRNGIEAAALLRQTSQPFHLVLVGPGVDHGNPSLMGLLRDAGMQDRASLLGQRHDIADLMAGFDVLCSCSASEAFPNVIGEAMASGVPCVVTDVGDSARVVGTTGIAVPPRNPQALAQGLGRLLALDEEQRRELGNAARWRIVTHFSLAEVVEQYEALYRRVAVRREQPAWST